MTGIVVVVGASAGVGRAIAVAFGKRGWKVALLARGAENLAQAARDVEAAGGTALAIAADAGDAIGLHAAAGRVEQELGPIDVWVNNAMVTIYAPVGEITPAEFEHATRVTYLGQVFGAQAALTHMKPRDRGAIIFINSALGMRSIPFQAPYCAAKAAVRGFVDALRSELIWEKKNIRLTTVYLPAVNTPQFEWARNRLGKRLMPVPPIFQPEDIAEAIFKAAQKTPREVWLGASTLKAIVGQIVVPGFIDRQLGKKGPALETEDRPDDPARADNFMQGGWRGVPLHGRFDDKARRHPFPFNPAYLRGLAAAVFLAAVTLLVVLL